MILGFKTKFPWGEPTYFKEKILGIPAYEQRNIPGVSEIQINFEHLKLHTIREGFRIKPGDTLHMATGVRTKNYNQFNKGIPGLEKCISIQRLRIYSDIKEVWIEKEVGEMYVKLLPSELETLALNDGFESVEQFWKWFTKDCIGQIIFWVDMKY